MLIAFLEISKSVFYLNDILNIDKPIITDTGLASLKQENAGGNSAISEAFSISFLETYYKASDFIFENDVNYVIKYKMVDYICSLPLENIRVGVSVSRGVYPRNSDFTFDTARHLLFKKLNGLIISQQTIDERMTFYYSILHIWCLDAHIERVITQVFPEFRQQPEYDNIILLTTVSNYEPIYRDNFKLFNTDYAI